MKRSWADAARVAEVREAAETWRDAGAIDAATFEAIGAAYPEPRPRLSAAWTVLVFFLSSMAIQAVCFGIAEVLRIQSSAVVIFFGVLLVGAAELLRGSRFAGNGSDAAASFWAIVYLLAGLAWWWSEGRRDPEALITLLAAVTVALFAAACARWGYAVYGTLAAVALFGLLGRFPAGRAWWVLASVTLLALAYRNLDRAALAPPHRGAMAGVFAVAAIALYVALNRCSVDFHWVESLRARSAAPIQAGLLALSTAATALLPAAFLAWSIRARRTLILDLGLVFAAASLVTLRWYVHVAPLWALLTLAGAALILGSLWFNRWLRRAPGGESERNGFTAAPLFSGRGAGALQAAAVVATFTPSPAPTAEAARAGDLTPGGGRFGGGGSSSEF